MKKMIGIFLAVCFVLSVTAAAASAERADNKGIIKEKSSPRLDYGKYKHYWKNKLWVWVWVPAHFESKVIKTYRYDRWHRHVIVIYKTIKIWIPGHWELKLFKYNQKNSCIRC